MAKHVIDFIRQPDALDGQSLAQLRSMVEKYPYYHAARIMLLKNLYEMHDSDFDHELRRAALYVPSRKTLFMMFEAENLRPENPIRKPSVAQLAEEAAKEEEKEDLTTQLIGNFLDTLPKSQEKTDTPRVADASVDYMTYALQTGAFDDEPETDTQGNSLIDQFLDKEHGQFNIDDDNEIELPASATNEGESALIEGRFTEQLAHIYIKQGKFDKAKEIILRLSAKNPKKNRYFADQIRFLDKLIINSRNK